MTILLIALFAIVAGIISTLTINLLRQIDQHMIRLNAGNKKPVKITRALNGVTYY